MVRQIYPRIVSVAGLCGLAVLIVGLDPFLSDPTAGAGYSQPTPSVSVDRTLKGDRLPILHSPILNAPDSQGGVGAQSTAPQMPVGCDPAFSPISSPLLANVYRRCTT